MKTKTTHTATLPVKINGVTKRVFGYSKKSVVFGVCDYYYDWSF